MANTYNPYNKEVTVEKPYAIYVNPIEDWEWRIIKVWTSPEKGYQDPKVRAMCAVKSPMTWGEWEYGDVWLKDICPVHAGGDNILELYGFKTYKVKEVTA